MAMDMDMYGLSNEGSPHVITQVDTYKEMGHVVAKKIWEYCA